MDEKRYITYEVICTMFLVGLVDNGLNHALSLHAALYESLASYNDKAEVKDLLEELKVRGGQSQL